MSQQCGYLPPPSSKPAGWRAMSSVGGTRLGVEFMAGGRRSAAAIEPIIGRRGLIKVNGTVSHGD